MKNFIFKSEADFHKIVFNKLDMLLSEQRHQRADLFTIDRKLHSIINTMNLQKQVDEYFSDPEDSAEDSGEARPGLPLEDNAKDIPEE